MLVRFLNPKKFVAAHLDYSQVHVTDPRISNRQLRVYSVIYDDGDGSDIMTLVYAEDLSSNGTFWNGLLIGKEKGGALLSDGDQLRISPDVDVFFHTNQQASVPLWDDVRVREQKVRFPAPLWSFEADKP